MKTNYGDTTGCAFFVVAGVGVLVVGLLYTFFA